MRKVVFLPLILWLGTQALAQDLTPAQQQQMLNDLQEMKAKVQALESKGASGGGLKKVNYEEETSDQKKTPGEPEGATLSAEEQQKIMEQINGIKAKQLEANETLKELDKDDE